MVERFQTPLRTTLGAEDATDTVVHDPQGHPWLVSTVQTCDARYETQVYYTARAGIRGFPTGHGERYDSRADAVSGHLRWCLRVRHGEVFPDLAPETGL